MVVLEGDASLAETERRLEEWGNWQNNLGGVFPRGAGKSGERTVYQLEDSQRMIDEVEGLVLQLMRTHRDLWAEVLKLTYIQRWNHSQIALRLKADRKYIGAQLAFAVVYMDGQLNPVVEKKFASGA